jgi:tetratricopeptide (TPR) repeat protein
MEPRSEGAGALEFERARRALSMDNSVAALACLERALGLEDNPRWYSYLGYCIARERGQVSKGVDLCMVSIERDPDSGEHYLNLGKVHLVSGNKTAAIQAFREGMVRGWSAEIVEQLKALGQRKPPVIGLLARTNPLNKYLGLFLSRIGLR